LNFGHTIGHAFESYAMTCEKPILHGYAVAYGMMAELYLSHKIAGLSRSDLEELSYWLMTIYGKFAIVPEDYDKLLELMSHDKKNEGKRINFTLLPKIGKVAIDQDCSRDMIIESLEFYRNLSL
jgi:3-dehydroquinate synthase